MVWSSQKSDKVCGMEYICSLCCIEHTHILTHTAHFHMRRLEGQEILMILDLQNDIASHFGLTMEKAKVSWLPLSHTESQ